MLLDRSAIIDTFSAALFHEKGTCFVGSGISKPSGLPDWSGLLQSSANGLGLVLDQHDDLPIIAQYIVNESGGNYGPLFGDVRSAIANKGVPNSYHRALACTNVSTIWTTNYDNLIERAFSAFDIDVKYNDDAFLRPTKRHQVEIIKVHGCIEHSPVTDLVLTEEQYQDFHERRPATAQRLRMELLDKSFLFIGYSHADANIRNVLVEARRLASKATRRHYWILKRDSSDAQTEKRQLLWCKNLERIGIFSYLINDHRELEDVLKAVSLKSRGPSVFITGSHLAPSPFAHEVGEKLAEVDNLILLDGQSLGIGREAISAFNEQCLRRNDDIYKRVRLFPNPYAANPAFSNNRQYLPTLKMWRSTLLRSAQVIVVFDGGMGTEAEVEVAEEVGCRILPVPLTIGDYAHRLVQRPEINTFLNTVDPAFLAKAQACILNPAEVTDCIQKMLDL